MPSLLVNDLSLPYSNCPYALCSMQDHPIIYPSIVFLTETPASI